MEVVPLSERLDVAFITRVDTEFMKVWPMSKRVRCMSTHLRTRLLAQYRFSYLFLQKPALVDIVNEQYSQPEKYCTHDQAVAC